jgi:hypothetical protein
VRWDWYTHEAFDPRPFWFERFWTSPGEQLDGEPAPDEDAVGYGYDEAGRIAVLREVVRGEQVAETTWTYGDDRVESTRVAADGTRSWTRTCRYDGDRLLSHESRANDGSGREEYTYADGRVVGIDTWHGDELFTTLVITYGPDGELDRIESTSARGQLTETLYRRPPAGETLDTLGDRVIDLLTDQIPAVVAQAAIDAPAYCLTLSYEQGSCRPRLGVGLESERANGSQWDPVEFGHWDLAWDFDPELAAAADLLDQEAGLAGDDDLLVEELLIEVARRLNRFDWRPVLPVTDDFLVSWVDLSADDLTPVPATL